MLENNCLTFLHLSDIHFSHKGPNHSLDEDLRNELTRDIKTLIEEKSITGILISGDISFSGKKSEFEIARSWIEELVKMTKCGTDNVRIVPGNHDVNWEKDTRSRKNHIQAIRNKFYQSQNKNEDVFHDFLKEEDIKKSIFDPFTNYNEFAVAFDSITDDKTIKWEKNYKLNDNSTLKISGLNTTLLSTQEDNISDKLLLGLNQATINRQDGITHLIVCHHPPNWLLDEDGVSELFNSRASIQLFGHKHSQKIDRINECIRITAGAVQPYREESNWLPRYNLLTLRVVKENDIRYLVVNVYARIYDKDTTSFVPDFDKPNGNIIHSYKIKIESWNNMNSDKLPIKQEEDVEKQEDTRKDIIYNEHIYKFLNLPYSKFVRIASNLNLIRDDDNTFETYQLKIEIIKRIKENNLYTNLVNEINILCEVKNE